MTNNGNEFHCVGLVKEKARCPKVFVFVKGMRKVLVSEMEQLSGWMADSQQFRKIDWVTFSERIVAQSCDVILDS